MHRLFFFLSFSSNLRNQRTQRLGITKKKEEEEEKKRTNMNYSHRMIYDNYRSGSLVSAVSIWYKTRSAIQPRMNSSSVITLEKKATNHRHYSKYNRIRLPIFIFILKIMRKES